jgi:hypothetical protein
MPYAELSGLVLGTGIATALICVLLYQIVQHDEFRRYHEVGYAVFLQSELPLSRSVRARLAG